MFRHVFKGVTTAFSLTFMLLAIVYTEQSRMARDAAPKQIGEERVQVSFLKDYADTRQAILVDFLNTQFPSLGLPAPEAPPESALSLSALKARQ